MEDGRGAMNFIEDLLITNTFSIFRLPSYM